MHEQTRMTKRVSLDEDTFNATRRGSFRARHTVPRLNGRERCRHLECWRTQKQFHVIAIFHQRLKRFFSNITWNDLTHVIRCKTKQGVRGGGPRTSSCASASLPRVKKSR